MGIICTKIEIYDGIKDLYYVLKINNMQQYFSH